MAKGKRKKKHTGERQPQAMTLADGKIVLTKEFDALIHEERVRRLQKCRRERIPHSKRPPEFAPATATALELISHMQRASLFASEIPGSAHDEASQAALYRAQFGRGYNDRTLAMTEEVIARIETGYLLPAFSGNPAQTLVAAFNFYWNELQSPGHIKAWCEERGHPYDDGLLAKVLQDGKMMALQATHHYFPIMRALCAMLERGESLPECIAALVADYKECKCQEMTAHDAGTAAVFHAALHNLDVNFFRHLADCMDAQIAFKCGEAKTPAPLQDAIATIYPNAHGEAIGRTGKRDALPAWTDIEIWIVGSASIPDWEKRDPDDRQRAITATCKTLGLRLAKNSEPDVTG